VADPGFDFTGMGVGAVPFLSLIVNGGEEVDNVDEINKCTAVAALLDVPIAKRMTKMYGAMSVSFIYIVG